MNRKDVVNRAVTLGTSEFLYVSKNWRERAKRAFTEVAGNVCVVEGCDEPRVNRDVLYCERHRFDHPKDAMLFPRAVLAWIDGMSPEEMILLKGPTANSADMLEELIQKFGLYSETSSSGVVATDQDFPPVEAPIAPVVAAPATEVVPAVAPDAVSSDGMEEIEPGTLTADDVALRLVPESMRVNVIVRGKVVGHYDCDSNLSDWAPSRSLRALYGCLPVSVRGWGEQYTPRLRAEFIRRVVEGDKRR